MQVTARSRLDGLDLLERGHPQGFAEVAVVVVQGGLVAAEYQMVDLAALGGSRFGRFGGRNLCNIVLRAN